MNALRRNTIPADAFLANDFKAVLARMYLMVQRGERQLSPPECVSTATDVSSERPFFRYVSTSLLTKQAIV
jgi:hypothetical protein